MDTKEHSENNVDRYNRINGVGKEKRKIKCLNALRKRR